MTMKRYLFFLLTSLMSLSLLAQAPAPDAYYTFDEANGTLVADSSANGYDAIWYNIFGEDPGSPQTSTAGWRPAEGYRNGAAYFAGDHAVCPQDCPDPNGGDCTCSSGSDLILFAEDDDGDCDDNFLSMAANDFYHATVNQLTVAFWYKNDWNYLCPAGQRRTCYKDDNDCAFERQVLFTIGDDAAGITIAIEPGATVPALVRASAAGDGTETEVQALGTDSALAFAPDWLHIAVVFDGDGASSGTFTLYFNGDSVQQRDTDFGTMTIGNNSAVFGGEHDKSVTGFDVTPCWPGSDLLLCGVTAPFYNTLRYGWPARGWLDELAYWRDQALTAEELTTFARIGDTTNTVGMVAPSALTFQVRPSLSQGQVTLVGLPTHQRFEVAITNAMGQVVHQQAEVMDRQPLTLPSSVPAGLYYLQVSQRGRRLGAAPFVLQW